MALPFEKTSTGAVLLRDASWKIVIEQWTTVPADSTAGYAKWALFIDTDVGAWTSWLYVNIGTTSASNFNLVTNAADA